MFKSVFALAFAAFGGGYAFQFMPDIGQSTNAAQYFFMMLAQEDEETMDSHLRKYKKYINK
jgi:hypothetical protein